MIGLLESAAAQGATLVVFPELAFTTFFPRWLLEGEALDQYYEPAMPNPAVQPLFDRARELGVTIAIGPDAHSVKQLDYVFGGVGMARKGGLEAKDVLNTRDADAVVAFARARRA